MNYETTCFLKDRPSQRCTKFLLPFGEPGVRKPLFGKVNGSGLRIPNLHKRAIQGICSLTRTLVKDARI